MTHDYTKRYWGHDYIFEPKKSDGLRASMMGWGHGLSNGDYLILENGNESTRYQIVHVKYLSDPKDMWHAYVKFAPR